MQDMVTQQSGPTAPRPMKAELGLLSQPDGSTMYTQGETTIMAAAYGPREVRMSKEFLDKATVDVIYKPKTGLPGAGDKFNESFVKKTCEAAILVSQHPRTAIDVIIQEMQDSGSFLSSCINAACLALLDAAVPMKYTVASVDCVIDQEENILIDPSKKQARDCQTHMTFAFDGTDFKVVSSYARGSYTNQQFQKCLLACREASKDVFAFYREVMTKKLESAF